ncbi:MAG: hypothetical protein J6B85_12585 [Lachnospiraceae bacterium]|nr:hypothetical protein [Lachnospiraceae bacterium]
MGLEDQFYRDMIESHSERMQNLMKYYPFFELQAQSLKLYKDGRYADVDMAYITMAVLRFFIEENHFHDRPVEYGQYMEFVTGILTKDFELDAGAGELRELASYLFDKLKNDGKPFTAEYFDPADRKRKTLRMKLIDSAFREGTVVYTVTADAIAFYLDTKEIKEESKITMEQLLLEKMITNRNYKGGIEVVRRINSEVNRLRVRKQEVLKILSLNVFEGVKALEDFQQTGMRWFEEEQSTFLRNKELIERALEKAREAGHGEDEERLAHRAGESGSSGRVGGAQASGGLGTAGNTSESRSLEPSGSPQVSGDSKYLAVFRDIYQLETELKRAMTNHSRLLADCMELSKQADERIRGYKFSRLRSVFDFQDYLAKMMELDNTDLLADAVLPMAAPAIKKRLAFGNLADLLSYPEEREEEPEKEEEKQEVMYRFDDEIEEERIGENYQAIVKTLLDTLLTRERFDLVTFNKILELKYFDDIFRNSDYYSFLVHICQKREYDLEKVREKQDTFLEDSIVRLLAESGGRYRGLRFRVDMTEPVTAAEVSDLAGGANSPDWDNAREESLIRHKIAGAERDSEFITSNLYFTRLV